MPTVNQWQEIERQDLIKLAKDLTGQETSVSDIQKHTQWGYNRSYRMAEMAIECEIAMLVHKKIGVTIEWLNTPGM